MMAKAAFFASFLTVLYFGLATSQSVVFSQTPSDKETTASIELKWRDPPLDNPLRGLVPYASQMPKFSEGSDEETREEFAKSLEKVFPHSVEFAYIPLAELVKGDGEFDWSAIDDVLKQTAGRGCQCTFRVYLEYPGEPAAIPKFLVEGGLKVKRWKSEDGAIHTPDYEDSNLRKTLRQTIAAMGERYDGDPRVAWLTVGILGLWGEWHDYPKEKLFASKTVQTEVLEAYEAAFKKTKLHLRYPAGDDDGYYVANADRNFGYHDDSFAWATIPTGKSEDDWFFGNLLESAGPAAVDKWKTNPIGGEIRPEAWGCVFEDPGCAPPGQEFEKCVRYTHVSWLMDSGLFLKPPSKKLVELAKKKTASMGYRLTIESAKLRTEAGKRSVTLTVNNRGVAPFYYPWNVETALLDRDNQATAQIANDWRLPEVMPNDATTWSLALPNEAPDQPRIGIRIPNPMPGGFPLRFANEEQMLDDGGWMVVDFSPREK